jgi:AcrR family transcriptional regulator
MGAKKKTPASSAPKVTAGSRTQLIDVTLRIILEHGIDAVRIDDILTEVGVTKGSLYWHFEDRNALIKAALAEHIQRLNEATIAGVSDAITGFDDKDSYFSRVAPYIADPFNADQVQERWNRLALFVETRNHPDLVEMMRDVQARNLDVFVELMTEAQKSGVLRPELDPRPTACGGRCRTLLRCSCSPVTRCRSTSRASATTPPHRLGWCPATPGSALRC